MTRGTWNGELGTRNSESGTSVVVVKLGGSVLVDLPAYQRYAALLRDRLGREPETALVVVVSAQYGETDALLAVARGIVDEPDTAALDLLWSTGEIRSAATLALCLHREGVRAVALNVHQTGIQKVSALCIDPWSIRRALAHHEVVIVPGFLARGRDDAVVTLGRGGSDLTAVALAAALDADRCELLKDVPGYFTADPNRVAAAQHLPTITYEQALAMARDGCDLVQTQALETARRTGLTLVIASALDARRTIVTSARPSATSRPAPQVGFRQSRLAAPARR